MPFQPKPRPSWDPISHASGLYSNRTQELRLDVVEAVEKDNPFPQMAASGNFIQSPESPDSKIYWVAAKLNKSKTYPNNYWTGKINYKVKISDTPTGNINPEYLSVRKFPTKVIIWLSGNPPKHQAYVRFVGDPSGSVISLPYWSPYFHQVKFEFAQTSGVEAVTAIDKRVFDELKQRPLALQDDLRVGDLSIESVFNRAGFDVTLTKPEPVDLGPAGDNKWSDSELHDFMVKKWSLTHPQDPTGPPPWTIWVLFTSKSEKNIRGIMFDSKDDTRRQGCAIFNDRPSPDTADSERTILISACHEIGHCFNLAHTGDRLSGPRAKWFLKWIGLKKDPPNTLSFMRTPEQNALGSNDLENFEYRFSGYDPQPQSPKGRELLFLRHAPEWFVEPGDKFYFIPDSELRMPDGSQKPRLKLELGTNPERTIFEYMEPVILELKLTNTSLQPQIVDKHLLSNSASMTVILKKEGEPARPLLRYKRLCWLPSQIELKHKETLSAPLFVSAGRGGWNIAEPGNYLIRVILHVNGEDIKSNLLQVRVAPPRGRDKKLQEHLAQDYFSDDVGRIINFNGSRVLDTGITTLYEVKEQLRYQWVALHASWALANSVAHEYKLLVEDKKTPGKQLRIEISPAKPEKEVRELLSAFLTAKKHELLKSFGRIVYERHENLCNKWFPKRGYPKTSGRLQDEKSERTY